MDESLESRKRKWKKKDNFFRNAALKATMVAVLWWGVYLARDHIPFFWQTVEYKIDQKQNSIIKILKYNILDENQRSDGQLCYKIAEFVMKDNGIKNPRTLRSWTEIKFNMREIKKIIEEHEKWKAERESDISDDDLDIFEDVITPTTKEEQELQNMIDEDIDSEAERQLEEASKLKNSNGKLESGVEKMKCKNWEYFWIDISHHNRRLNWEKLVKTNWDKWKNSKPDVRWISFIYQRATDCVTKDRNCSWNVNAIRQYNSVKSVWERDEKIAVWFYHRMWSIGTWVEQANKFLEVYRKNTWLTNGNTMIPMLDIEWSWMKSVSKDFVRRKALNWLNTVEKSTWVKPWLYLTASIYRDYFYNDKRFSSYPVWLAAYPPEDRQWKEVWKSWRINFKEWTVDIWSPKNHIVVKPVCYQSSQQWKLAWTGNHQWHTDMDHCKNMDKLLSAYNKSNWAPKITPQKESVTPQKATPKPKKNVPKKAVSRKKIQNKPLGKTPKKINKVPQKNKKQNKRRR